MNIRHLVFQQREYFNTDVTRDISFRIKQLQLLKKVLKENEESLLNAIYDDLKKSSYNTITTELSLIYGKITHSIRDLPKWSRKRRVKRSLLNFPEQSYLLAEPYGLTYIADVWNYPYQLTLLPLVSAIAPGIPRL